MAQSLEVRTQVPEQKRKEDLLKLEKGKENIESLIRQFSIEIKSGHDYQNPKNLARFMPAAESLAILSAIQQGNFRLISNFLNNSNNKFLLKVGTVIIAEKMVQTLCADYLQNQHKRTEKSEEIYNILLEERGHSKDVRFFATDMLIKGFCDSTSLGLRQQVLKEFNSYIKELEDKSKQAVIEFYQERINGVRSQAEYVKERRGNKIILILQSSLESYKNTLSSEKKSPEKSPAALGILISNMIKYMLEDTRALNKFMHSDMTSGDGIISKNYEALEYILKHAIKDVTRNLNVEQNINCNKVFNSLINLDNLLYCINESGIQLNRTSISRIQNLLKTIDLNKGIYQDELSISLRASQTMIKQCLDRFETSSIFSPSPTHSNISSRSNSSVSDTSDISFRSDSSALDTSDISSRSDLSVSLGASSIIPLVSSSLVSDTDSASSIPSLSKLSQIRVQVEREKTKQDGQPICIPAYPISPVATSSIPLHADKSQSHKK